MTPADLPLVRALRDAGPDDGVFDAFVLAGPAVLLVVALAGRNVGTTLLASAYVAAFVLYVLYRGLTYRAE